MIARRAPYLLHYVRHYNKHSEIYVIYKAVCTSSLIERYRQTDGWTDTGHDIVASAMKEIATVKLVLTTTTTATTITTTITTTTIVLPLLQ